MNRALSINNNNRFSNLEEFWQALGMQPGWKPLDKAVVALSAPSTHPLTAKKITDTPMPAVVAVHKQAQVSRSRNFWLWFLILLLVIVLAVIGTGLYSFF